MITAIWDESAGKMFLRLLLSASLVSESLLLTIRLQEVVIRATLSTWQRGCYLLKYFPVGSMISATLY
jgi:hypothetical protein